ncbi:MAG: DUF5615 family PIN-like protein [Gammaproteobacteria bacterium]
MKFLVDENLQRLGSWLRAAGYDTLIESDGRPDYALLKQALAEERLLITRDRKLTEHRRAPGTVILLECENLEACIAALCRQLPIDWLHEPFVRCLVCNTRLIHARPEQLLDLPTRLRNRIDRAYYCPGCKKVYWDGSHVRRMRTRLNEWQQRFGQPAVGDIASPPSAV